MALVLLQNYCTGRVICGSLKNQLVTFSGLRDMHFGL
jgi:hypothetical protein